METVLHLRLLLSRPYYISLSCVQPLSTGSVTSFSLTVLSKGIIPVYSKDSIEIGWLAHYNFLESCFKKAYLHSSADFSTFDDKERMKHRVQTIASCLNSSNLVSGIYN